MTAARGGRFGQSLAGTERAELNSAPVIGAVPGSTAMNMRRLRAQSHISGMSRLILLVCVRVTSSIDT